MAQPTPAQLAWVEAQEELRSHKVQMFSCTVYDRKMTQVRWTHEGERYLAYTNADFNHLRGVMTIETETDRYDYFMGSATQRVIGRASRCPHYRPSVRTAPNTP